LYTGGPIFYVGPRPLKSQFRPVPQPTALSGGESDTSSQRIPGLPALALHDLWAGRNQPGSHGLGRPDPARVGNPVTTGSTVSNNVLYIHPLYLSFTVSSKKIHPLYLISLQQRPLNHVLYTQIPILKTFFNFIFCIYVFIILSNVLYIF
jgi:hypothetical protein